MKWTENSRLQDKKTMQNQEKLREAILKKLKMVIDPETGADVVRMRLVEDLSIDSVGLVKYTFRPSSELCPIAIPLSLAIEKAIASVPGVQGQEIRVTGYIHAEELTALLQELELKKKV